MTPAMTKTSKPSDRLAELAEEYNASGHSVFGPSASSRWMNCAGSLIANMLEGDSTSFEAAEGTVAHDIAEQWLKTGERPLHLVGTTRIYREKEGTENEVEYEIPITRTMLDYIQEYVDWCEYLDGDHFVEVRVDFSKYTPIPRQGGTCDHAACIPKKLTVTDFKYGKGVYVEVENNSQALLYALGFFEEYDSKYHFEEIEIRICQPRMNNYGTWTISREYLLNFAEKVRKKAARAWNTLAPRKPHPKACEFCLVRSRCTAIAKLIDAVLEGRIYDVDREYTHDELEAFGSSLERGTYKMKPVVVDQLSDEQLAVLLPYRRVVEKWFKSVFFELERRALEGRGIKDHKLVESRSNREFIDPTQAEETLYLIGLERSDIYTEKMASPAQVEDILREKLDIPRKEIPELVERYVRKPPGKPTLVHVSDKRPALDDITDDIWDDELDDLYDEL